MYVFHSTVRVKPGKDADFEAFYYAGDPVELAPGYLGRQLIKDKDHPGTYFYIAFWESFAALQACRATDTSIAKARGMNGADVFAAPIELVECELPYSHGFGKPFDGAPR